MKLTSLILVAIILCELSAKSESQVSGKAKTLAACSVAHSGNNDTINIKNCGIGKEQADTIIAILKAVLANQKAEEREAKLTELLVIAQRATNPYGSVITYQPNGIERIHTESTGTFAADSSALIDFNAITAKRRSKDWLGQIDLSQKALQKYPGWFTPDLTLGEAQGMLCRKEEALASLQKFIKETDGAVAYADLRVRAQVYIDNLQKNDDAVYCSTHK